ncbi:hypothetical protein [Jiella mangrovi]|uniref:J domain-containing protein n=1 Tax=Jiella mangrovi TaxID=2821407 RepID=A0ABS4BK67_9HYPH|nr:hypothetical protein [Jiella mangrovi]MBP0616566.1 hypothetical protein [Jiella mangrovi]
MVDQSFETILEGVAARHEDKSWRSVLNRASNGMMSVIGMRKGPKIAETVSRTATARAAYEEDFDDEEDFSEFDPPKPEAAQARDTRQETEPPKAAHSAEPGKGRQGSAAQAEAAYAKAVEDAPAPGAPTTDPYEIARELNILTASSVKDLLDARRNFARKNHPDRMPILYRPQANTRMQIANRLIDDAIAKMSGQGRR